MAKASKHQDESQWLSVSDLMAGLMMVFVFIAISLMSHAYKQRDKVQEIAVIYLENQEAWYTALNAEFQDELIIWDAEIDEDTLNFTFKSPDVLFAVGDSKLTPRFEQILDDFFPRYLDVLLNGCFESSRGDKQCFKKTIAEIRIEGHTSSDWNRSTSADEAYFENMRLSQERTRSVLNYTYNLQDNRVVDNKIWIKKHIAAVGLSSSQLVAINRGCREVIVGDIHCGEDRERSRRVTFRVVTNADVQIKSILN